MLIVRGSVVVTEEFYRLGRPLRVLVLASPQAGHKKTQASQPGLFQLIQNAVQKLATRWAVQINRIRNT